MKTVRLVISGKVQGVFFRATAKKVADKLGLGGWVKNTANGDVEMMVSGDEDAVEELISWAEKGPSTASVTHVEIQNHQPKEFSTFDVIR